MVKKYYTPPISVKSGEDTYYQHRTHTTHANNLTKTSIRANITRIPSINIRKTPIVMVAIAPDNTRLNIISNNYLLSNNSHKFNRSKKTIYIKQINNRVT